MSKAVRHSIQSVGSRKIILQGHDDFISTTLFSPSGKMLASGSRDGTIRLWDIGTGCVIKILTGEADILTGMAFSNDGTNLFTAWSDKFVTWDVKTGKKTNEKEILANRRRHALVFSSNQKFIAYGTRNTLINVVDLKNWRELFTLDEHESEVWAVSISPNHKFLASSDSRKNVFLWDLNSRKKLHELRGHTNIAHDVKFSPDGSLLASSGMEEDQTVRLWDVFNGREKFCLKGHRYHVWDLVFTPNGNWLISGSEDTTVCIWDIKLLRDMNFIVDDGLMSQEFFHGVNYQSGISYDPYSSLVAFATQGNDIQVWNLSL